MESLKVFQIFLKLGLTSFGGPIAHLAFFRQEFVHRQKWLSDKAYLELVSLCQFLPGPASSQVGIAIGLSRSGYFGAFAAWLGFTLPSAIILILFGLSVATLPGQMDVNLFHGLKIAVVAVVAQAIIGMGRKLCSDWKTVALALGAFVVTSLFSGSLGQILAIVFGAFLGWVLLRPNQTLSHAPFQNSVSKKAAFISLAVLFGVLFFVPVILSVTNIPSLKLFDGFFQAGSLVFGGGHVVLPLLHAQFVPNGLVTANDFMAGYGVAQVIPGPLFAFASFLGAVSTAQPSGAVGALIGLVGIFLPSFLIIVGIMPFWELLRRHPRFQSVIMGANAAVVGLLIAAFIHPVWTSAIFSMSDFLLAAITLYLLEFRNLPSWAAVLICCIAGVFI